MSKHLILTVLVFLLISLISPGYQRGQTNLKADNSNDNDFYEIYKSLNDSSLNSEAFQIALQGQKILSDRGIISKKDLLTIIDYSLSSTTERFYVIDINTRNILYKTFVAHGKNSGDLYASRFSNINHSHQSALGFYVTGKPYIGSQGYSLIMNGVDTGFNDNAQKRAIVIHGANYATRRYIEVNGRLGRSFGCPALPPDLNSSIIDLIKEGTVIFGYYPEEKYLKESRILSYLGKTDLLNSH